MKQFRTIDFWLILLIGLTSCQSGNVFEKYQKMERMSWDRFNILVFEVPIEDINKEYDFSISIRHIPEIPYKELEVNFTIYTPSDDMRSANLVFPLVDKEGKSMSSCMGDLCDLEISLRKNFKFTETGTARVEIENRYTKISMPGIMEVGLIVRESEKE